MIYPRFSCIVTGPAFFPCRVPRATDLIIEKAMDAEPSGRAGKAFVSTTPNDSLKALIECLEKYAPTLRKHGADEIEVYAAIKYEDQANWEISPDQMARLARLNAHLLMSFYEEK